MPQVWAQFGRAKQGAGDTAGPGLINSGGYVVIGCLHASPFPARVPQTEDPGLYQLTLLGPFRIPSQGAAHHSDLFRTLERGAGSDIVLQLNRPCSCFYLSRPSHPLQNSFLPNSSSFNKHHIQTLGDLGSRKSVIPMNGRRTAIVVFSRRQSFNRNSSGIVSSFGRTILSLRAGGHLTVKWEEAREERVCKLAKGIRKCRSHPDFSTLSSGLDVLIDGAVFVGNEARREEIRNELAS